jgi:hypothetical protein
MVAHCLLLALLLLSGVADARRDPSGLSRKDLRSLREQRKAYCTVACQQPDGYVPFLPFDLPRVGVLPGPTKARIKLCMDSPFDDRGNSTVLRTCFGEPRPSDKAASVTRKNRAFVRTICLRRRVRGVPPRREAGPEELDVLVHTLTASVGLVGPHAADGVPCRTRADQHHEDRPGRHPQDQPRAPGLGRHLRTTVRTGVFFSYTPDSRLAAAWVS